MRKFLAGLSLVFAALLTPLPAVASLHSDPGTAQEIVRSLGCTATVSSVPSSGFNAYYSPGSHRIVLIGFDNIPEPWQKLILLHETGHCLQFQDNTWQGLRARGPYELEWDADAFAIRKLQELYGVDGADLNHEIWASLYRQYGYEGDLEDSHGLLTHRIMRGHLNRVTTNLEAP